MPSHGALSKAGKVRSITPKIDSAKSSSRGPKVSNRRLYNGRVILGRNSGQYKPGGRRYGRRR